MAAVATYYTGANERIISRVPVDAKRVLDVGCAAGVLGEILKSRADREVWGIELVPAVAAEAKRRLNHVLVGDVEAMNPLPLPERYFDFVICGDVLEHLRDPQTVLARLRKHVAPGAPLIANVPNIAHWSVIVGLLKGEFRYEDKGLLDRTHLHFFTPSSFRDLLWEAGYLVIEEDPLKLRDGGASKAIGNAASALGLDGAIAEDAASTYQHLIVAKPVPDPYAEPEKMAALVGPHIGRLGPASKRCSVAVLTYNSMKTIEACLTSLLRTLSSEDELIVVDNASQDGTGEYLKAFAQPPSGPAQERPSIQVILNQENFGFSKGCNIGILASGGEHIILLNPDTQVWPGWIEGLLAPFADPRVGAVGPLSDNVCGDQFVGLYLSPQQMTSPDAIAAAVLGQSAIGNKDSKIETRLLIGFSLALRRDLLDRFGLLEEKCHLGADDLEMSWRLTTLGHKLMVAQSVFVAHQCGASFGSLPLEVKRDQVAASDRALIAKMAGYYETPILPTSNALWGSGIFAQALLPCRRG